MSMDLSDRDQRFNIILRALDTSDLIETKLNELETLSHQIDDFHLKGLIENSSDVGAILRDSPRGEDYAKLVRLPKDVELIVGLTNELELCIDDPKKINQAVNVLEYIEQLHKNYGNNVPLVETIYRQSLRQRAYLTASLCNRLEDLRDASREELRSVVNQLMNCSDFSVRELKLRFLQARDNWFNDECEARSDSFDELISFFCKGLPQIFEEYKGIFSDSCISTSRKLRSITSDDPTKEDGAIINSWLLLKTTTFILSLEVHLRSVGKSEFLTPTMLGDTMEKCFRLTDWLSSIGFDFNSQLRPLFAKAIIEEVNHSIERATARFETEFTKIISKSVESLLLPLEDEILRISNMKPEEQLPKSIGHYPVFKIYCLNIINSLRWIRTTQSLTSPINLCSDTYAALNASLTRVMKALAVVLNIDNNSNHPILSKIAISFLTEVLPFFTNYCELFFPEKVILNSIGLSKAEFKTIHTSEPEKVRNLFLDLRQIAEPLKGTMPALMQTIEH